MSSVNKVILVGHLGRDPEMRSTNSGDRIANLSVATSENWRDRNSGERKERTEWHRVVIFNDRLSEVAEKYLSKGSQVYIEGQLQTRKWTDQQGQERYSTEVVLTKFKGELTMLGGGQTDRNETAGQQREPERAEPRRSAREELDDDIPFVTSDLAYDPAFRKAHRMVV